MGSLGLSLSLWQKALILLVVPLAAELIFIVVLTGLIAQSDKDRLAEAHARDTAVEMTNLLNRFLDRSSSLVLWKVSGDEGFYRRFQEAQPKIHAQAEVLRKLIEPYPEERIAFSRIDALQNKLDGCLDEAQQAAQHDDKIAAVRAWSKIRVGMNQLLVAIEEAIGKQHDVARQKADRLRDSRNQVQTVLNIALGANILLVLFLAAFFHRDTTSRLNLLMSNVRRFGSGLPLIPGPRGKDEIAKIDSAFREMSELIEEARRREKEIDQMKRDFVAMVSHDLRTPLTAIQSVHALLETDVCGELNEDGHDYLDIAEENVSRLIALVNDLLDLEKMETARLDLKLEDISLNDVVRASMNSVRAVAAEKGIEISYDSDQNFYVMVDRDRIVQVLVNLLSNAVKFSPESSKVLVTAQLLGTDSVKVCVTDSGRGVPADKRRMIFERFKQVDRSDSTEKKGTGLGLAICKAIIECHGGKIGVDSEEGSGSTFWFTVPAPIQGNG